MIGAFTSRLAVETPDGVNRTFNSPVPFAGTVYVTVNDVVQYQGVTFTGGTTTIQFAAAPQVGDVVGFLYNPS